MMAKSKRSEETRERLLSTAAEHFAQKGFWQARVHDICAEAGVNQAAVSYHFGGKYELYVSSLKYALELANAQFPLPTDSSIPAEEGLHSFLTAMLQRIFDESDGSLFPRMMLKEMAEPSEAHEEILRDLIASERDALDSIIREILGSEATLEDVMISHLSVVALFQFFNFSRAIRQLIVKKKRRPHPSVDSIIEHTVSFALAGLRAKRREIDNRG